MTKNINYMIHNLKNIKQNGKKSWKPILEKKSKKIKPYYDKKRRRKSMKKV